MGAWTILLDPSPANGNWTATSRLTSFQMGRDSRVPAELVFRVSDPITKQLVGEVTSTTSDITSKWSAI